MTNFTSSANSDANPSPSAENIVQRLRRRTREAKAMGFRIRTEWLDDQQASWCEIGGVKTLFIDLSQSASEQLQQLEESLASFADAQKAGNHPASRAA